MAKVNRNVLITVIALLIIAGGVGTLVVTNDDSATKNSKGTSSSSPAITASPTTLVKDIFSYDGKTVAVKGHIVLFDKEKTYYVSGNEAKPGAIKLDFSQTSIKPTAYVDQVTSTKDGKYTPKNVIVTGKVHASNKNQQPYLIVSDIKFEKSSK